MVLFRMNGVMMLCKASIEKHKKWTEQNCSFSTRGDGARIHFLEGPLDWYKFKDELYRLARGCSCNRKYGKGLKENFI